MARIGTDILQTMHETRIASDWRKKLIITSVFIVFSFLCLYTLKLGLTGTDKIRSVAANSASVTRGDIVDRNGEILAKNIYTYDLVMNAKQIEDLDKAAIFIHSVFPDISVNAVIKAAKTGKGYLELKKNIDKETAQKVKKEKIEGVLAIEQQVREYPKGNSMSHIIGFINKDGNGAMGIERLANDRLKSNSEPLELSLDSRIQSIMWSELSAAMQKYKATAATGIFMNSRTGEIISIVSLPDFDPENISAFPVSSQRFRALRDNFETGSIFKIFNTALALANGLPITRTYNIADPFIVGGRKIEEASGFKPPAKNLTIAQIMQYSCNSGSAQIALSLPETAQIEFFKMLHLDRPIDTDFGRTERPLFPTSTTPTDRSRWSFGHGIAVTPMHTFLAANAIANDGLYINPTIYRRDFVPQTERIVSREISRKVRQIMFMVGDTSAKLATMQIQGIHVGGKTSTAQKLIDGKYSRTKNMTAFFAVFPIEAPKWTMMILLDEPDGYPRTSAYNAVPVAGAIMNAVIPLL